MTDTKECETCGQGLPVGSKAEATAEAARQKAAEITEADLDAADPWGSVTVAEVAEDEDPLP